MKCQEIMGCVFLVVYLTFNFVDGISVEKDLSMTLQQKITLDKVFETTKYSHELYKKK